MSAFSFSSLISWSNENKSCTRADKREFLREFFQLSSPGQTSCMRVDESRQARVCMRVFSTFMSWSNEDKSCMRVEKREFV